MNIQSNTRPIFFNESKGFGFTVPDFSKTDLFVNAENKPESPLRSDVEGVNLFANDIIQSRAGKDGIEVSITPRSLNKKIQKMTELGEKITDTISSINEIIPRSIYQNDAAVSQTGGSPSLTPWNK